MTPLLVLSLALPAPLYSQAPVEGLDPSKEYKKRETGLYADAFDQNFYEEGVQFLRLCHLFRRLLFKKIRARNVNVFDEVPDSLFFTNRHGKRRLSSGELKKGANVGEGPDRTGPWTVTKGKISGVTPGFFIKDSKGERFLLKLDPPDFPELATSTEVVASRFFYAFGYNVPEYSLVYFNPEDLQVDEESTFYDKDGFKKRLTIDKVREWLNPLPRRPDGRYRAVASKILPGKILGNFSFEGRQKNDPNDPFPHRDRREIRSLRTFASWLNNADIRESNTLDTLVEVDGKTVIRHYLIDFGSSFGSMGKGSKPLQSGDEYNIDWGESFKALLGLGFYEKPWEKRLMITGGGGPYPSVGSFTSEVFDPGKWKTIFPYHAFKGETPADAFWAAKIIMSFTNEEIDAIVSAGEYSDEGARRFISETLIARRDAVGKYWFRKVAPLDSFEVARRPDGNYEISFTDLALKYGLEEVSSRRYHYHAGRGKIKGEIGTPSVTLSGDWVRTKEKIKICLAASSEPEGKKARWLKLMLQRTGEDLRVTGIDRGV